MSQLVALDWRICSGGPRITTLLPAGLAPLFTVHEEPSFYSLS